MQNCAGVVDGIYRGRYDVGQTSLLSKKSQTSYANPSLAVALPGEVNSVGNDIVRLQGSNLGLADSSGTPVLTSIEIIYQNSFYEVDMDTSRNAAEIPFPELYIMAFIKLRLDLQPLNASFAIRFFLRE